MVAWTVAIVVDTNLDAMEEEKTSWNNQYFELR